MSTTSEANVDGIYAAYFTGATGNSFALFLFKDGSIAGADGGGGIYDGEYTISEDQDYVVGRIQFKMPTGGTSITGVTSQEEPIIFEIPIKLPVNISSQDVHRIETPAGPINAKFHLIRKL